ncbi:MAG: hypothetical protein K0S25_1842 [Bacillus sp. (in: firmicutes)]|jgi:hypothetical protein|nr:hypothetical protein [Bacillus sp. (in: firmicutes)]
MSTDDLMNGRTADLGEYVKRAAQAGFVGLITGAIFGPLLAGATGLAFVGLSGGASAYSSWLNDMLFNGGKIDYENLELATALGIFCGAVAKPGKVSAAESPGKARYGERQISNEEYQELRDLTPSKEIRKMVNKDVELPMSDPALPGKTITKKLEADHIVPMDKITRMDGFGTLTKEQQLEVLNNPENFAGLSKTANTSKGSKTFEEWTTYKKENITVDPTFRGKMIEKSSEMEGKLQKQIDDF